MELFHYRNDDWVVLCQVCYFFADRISKMATTGQLSLPLDPNQNNRSGVEPSKEHSNNAKNSICQVVSQKRSLNEISIGSNGKLLLPCGGHLGYAIGTKITNFRFGPNLAEMFIGRSSTRFVILVQIGNPT
jgi:hypothetical protein